MTRAVDEPRPGFFRIRLVKGGPWVAARIEHRPSRDPLTGELLDRSPLWRVTIAGEELPASPDPLRAGVFRVWHSGQPISESEYRYLTARREHAIRYEPDLPEAAPRERIDLLSMPLPL